MADFDPNRPVTPTKEEGTPITPAARPTKTPKTADNIEPDADVNICITKLIFIPSNN